MSDPYADALGVAAPAAAQARPDASEWRAVSAKQRFDGNSIAILEQEAKDAKTPADAASIAKTKAYTQAKIAGQDGAAAAPVTDPYSDALGFGKTGAAPATPAATSTAAPQTGASRSQPWYGQLGKLADTVGGVGETIANGALGTAGALGGGLAEVGGLLTGSTDRAQRWNDWASRNISTLAGLYDPTPETATGKAINDTIGGAFDKLKQGAGLLGSKTLEATGSPALATIVDTGTQAAAQGAAAAVGAKAARILGRGVSGDLGEVQAPLDNGSGKAPVPVSTEGLARKVSGGGAAVSSGNPYPELTGQQSVRGGDFPQLKLSQVGGDLPEGQQAVRSAVAGQILGEGGDRIRPGVASGNEDTLRTESALAKAANPTPQGVMLRDKMAQEQRALGAFADSVVNRTGASQTLLNDGARGDLLNSSLYGPESLRSFLADQKNQIYADAAQRQGPNPVVLPSLEKMANSPQLSSSLKIAGLPNMLPGIQELLEQFKTNGFENPVTGDAIPPNSVAAAMELHKALNSAWTPENSSYIGRMKRAILDDVAQAGGADLYQRGNAIHAAEQKIFEAPGMKKIFGDADPNTGISKGLSPEKILSAINNLPIDQYTHVYNTFHDMSLGRVPGSADLHLPPELAAAGAQAVKEMAGGLVRDVRDAGADKAGVWNANSANKTLNSHSQKLQIAATPDVLRDLHTLNVGGQIMPGMHAYEGAAQQARRLDQAGLFERHLPKLGAVAGGFTGIPGGEVGGMKLGETIQKKVALKRQMQQVHQTDADMESAAKRGSTLRDLMR